MKLRNRSVLITGAKGGLGNFVTERFLAEGALVTGVSRSIEKSDFPHLHFGALQSDLSSLSEARRVVSAVLERHGRIDAVVHLVGGFRAGVNVADSSDELQLDMMQMNFLSAFHVVRAVLPEFQRTGAGSILTIGSRAAMAPAVCQSAYAASKAALIALIRSVAVEYPAVRANVVIPGTLDTPANRLAMPDADSTSWIPPGEAAALIAFLATDEAKHLTGAVIPIGLASL